MSITVLCICFFVIATIYSSVGFGGGSSYIALLLLANLPVVDIRFVALICNVVVVSTGCYYFYKSKILNPKKLVPLIILSIPMAFIGGIFEPQTTMYKIIAAIALIGAALIMMVSTSEGVRKISNASLSGIGGGIGLVSGFIGIGGGIFLSPVLHLINWNKAKKISAAASFFILVNSIAGLIGQAVNKPNLDWQLCIMLGISVFVGGQIGNRLNIHILSPRKIKFITAVLIAFVGFRILYIQFV